MVAFSPETNDLDNFYLNDEARKVVEAAIKRSNFFYTNGWNYQIRTAILDGTSAQVKSVLDSYADEVQAGCDDSNKMLNELPQ